MEMSINSHGGSCEVRLHGAFTFADNTAFRAVIEHVGLPEIRSFEIDFSDVDFIDSAVLGMLMILRNESAKYGQSVTIRGARGQVEKVMRMAKFDSKFTMVKEKI
jgi:anti-anti-sigma factor